MKEQKVPEVIKLIESFEAMDTKEVTWHMDRMPMVELMRVFAHSHKRVREAARRAIKRR